MTVAHRRGMDINVELLQKRLGVPVVACEAAKGKGIMELRLALSQNPLPVPLLKMEKPHLIDEAVDALLPLMEHWEGKETVLGRGESRLLLSCDEDPGLGVELWGEVRKWQQRFDREAPGWRSNWITTRYAWIGEVVHETVELMTSVEQSVESIEVIVCSGIIIRGSRQVVIPQGD